MHHIMQHINLIFIACWFSSGIVNWFAMNGYNNATFREKSKFDEPPIWILLASIFSGFGGMIVSLLMIGKIKNWEMKPLSKKKRNEILMLKN